VPVEARETIRRLERMLQVTLAPLVPKGGGVALLDFPNHNNSGDSAIWLGELRYLAQRGTRLLYVSDAATYDPVDLRRVLPPDGTVLLHGGGNFGDLWPLHHSFRLRVIQDFPDRRIVQLPQTIRVADEKATWKPLVDERGRYCVLCRDHRSVTLAHKIPRAQVHLAPDMAFFLGELERHREPDRDVVWITRRDHEGMHETPSRVEALAVLISDWLAVSGSARAVRAVMVRTRGLVSRAALASQRHQQLRPLRRAAIAPHQLLARRRLTHAVRLLSRGRAVVTDRLHGHTLWWVLGIPHVLLEDRGGKIRGFVDAFSTHLPGVEFATSAEQALLRARELAAA
jgi:exopolysaccharide biosynthesis predicted pyruvyltransferase EpsI